MSERNTSIRQKNILKKTTKNIRGFLSTKNYQKFVTAAIVFAVIFLTQLSASGEPGNQAGSQQPDYGSSENSQITDASAVTNDAPAAETNSSPNVSIISDTTSNNTVPAPQVLTQVTVNGENMPVDDNGSVHKTITTHGGTTNIDVSAQNSGNSWSSSSSVNSFQSSINNYTVITNSAGGSAN